MFRALFLCSQQGEKGLQRRGQVFLPVEGGVILPGEADAFQEQGGQEPLCQLALSQFRRDNGHPQPCLGGLQ